MWKQDEGPCANDPLLCHSSTLCSCFTFIYFILPFFQFAASRQFTSLAFFPKRFRSFWSDLLEAFPVVLSLLPPSLSLWFHGHFFILMLFIFPHLSFISICLFSCRSCVFFYFLHPFSPTILMKLLHALFHVCLSFFPEEWMKHKRTNLLFFMTENLLFFMAANNYRE